jgi:hypothetical protein
MQIDLFFEKLTSRLNFIVEYYFLFIVELHIYVNHDINLV